MQCIYCGREEDAVCMTRADMDPKDGFNRDPLCNSAFYELGGGEQGTRAQDTHIEPKAEEQPEDLVAARLAELERENARLRTANAVLVNGYYDIRRLIARRAEFERPFDLLVEIGMVEQNALTEALYPTDEAGQGEGTARKRSLRIEWLTDSSDCETCGTNYAEGAVVTLDGQTLLDLQPVAHCHGGAHWSESEVYALVLDLLGYALSEG